LTHTDLGSFVGVGSIHGHLNSGGVKSLLTAAPGNSQQDEGYSHGRGEAQRLPLGKVTAGAAAPYRPRKSGPGGEVPTLLRRRRCLIRLDMRPGLDSPNDGREILFETYEMLAAE